METILGQVENKAPTILRAFEYKCRRCGEIFDEGYDEDAEAVEERVHLFAIPDERDLKVLERDHEMMFSDELLRMAYHQCKDGGTGVGDLVGCSPEYDNRNLEQKGRE